MHFSMAILKRCKADDIGSHHHELVLTANYTIESDVRNVLIEFFWCTCKIVNQSNQKF